MMREREIKKLFDSAMVVAEQYVDALDDRGEMTKLERELTLLESSRYIVMDRTVPKSKLEDNKDALDDELNARIKQAISDALQRAVRENGLYKISTDQTMLAVLTEFALILRDTVKMGADMAVSLAVQAAKNGMNSEIKVKNEPAPSRVQERNEPQEQPEPPREEQHSEPEPTGEISYDALS